MLLILLLILVQVVIPDSSVARVVCNYQEEPLVAVLILGHPRTLYAETTYETIIANAINAFGGDSKVFVYLQNDVPEGGRDLSDSNITLYTEAINRLNPVSHTFAQSFAPHGCIIGPEEHQDRYMSQISSLKSAFKLITDYENRHNTTFDFVLRIRPDSVFLTGIRPYCFWGDGIGVPQLPVPMDYFNIVPRKYADTFFNMVDSLSPCPANFDINWHTDGGGPTGFMRGFLLRNNISLIDRWSMPIALVREGDSKYVYCIEELWRNEEQCLKVLHKL